MTEVLTVGCGLGRVVEQVVRHRLGLGLAEGCLISVVCDWVKGAEDKGDP